MATETIEQTLKAIEQSLDETLAMSRVLLALRLVQDGHAKNMGEGMRIAEDMDRVRAIYPVDDDA